jgi:hypothetical protein
VEFEEGESMMTKMLALFVAGVAMTLGISSSAIAQTMDNPSPSEAPSQSPAADTNQSTLTCGVSLFKQEQEELVQFGYPTPVSQRARACEKLGYTNPYPAPAMLDADGFVYPYDPIEGQYMYFDPNTGFYYVLDAATGKVSTYDPVKGIYL